MNKQWFIDDDWNVNDEARVFVEELKNSILKRHPEATFDITPGHDYPPGIHLNVYVDLDDPFEVTDEILDRIVDIQVDEGVPLHVIPMRTSTLELELREREESRRLSLGA